MSSRPFHRRYPTRPCAVCGSLVRRILFRHSFAAIEGSHELVSGYDLVVCDDCGFCFADHIPSQSALDVYYREMSKYQYANHDGQVSSYDWERFRRVADHLGQIIPRRSDRIMEIGCATGALLFLLKQRGYENVVGVDPAPACAEIGSRLYGISIQTNTLGGMTGKERSADVLILAGVLEHVHDLSRAVKKCRDILSENGILYVAVPDASLYSRGEDAPFQEFSVEHINFFGPGSLINLMARYGLALIRMDQIMITSNIRTTTPVVIGAFQQRRSPAPANLARDLDTEAGLRLYIDQSQQQAEKVEAIIDKVIEREQTIIVWGTGTHTLRLLATGHLGRAHIRAFVDSNPNYSGKQLHGAPIVSPQDIKQWSDPILISSRVYQEDIASQITGALQLRNEIIRLYPYEQRFSLDTE